MSLGPRWVNRRRRPPTTRGRAARAETPMILGATFETIDVIELLVLFAIPIILIVLLVRSFRTPRAKREVEEPKAGVA